MNWIGRRAARLSQGDARTYAAAAAYSDFPNSGVNPSVHSIKPGKCCVPYSWFSGAMPGSMLPRIMFSRNMGGTGAKWHSSTPSASSAFLHPCTYGHAVSSAHFSFSPR